METIHDIEGNGETQVRSMMSRVEGVITAHPLPVVGAAFALGAIVAFATGGSRKDERSVGGMIVAGVAAVALRLAKGYALSRLGDAAKSWLMDERGDAASPSRTERAASNEPATESFLRH
jgi:hypothetical protein